MNNLLYIEWLKIKKYKTFWILIGFFVTLLPLWNYGLSNGFLKLSGNNKSGGVDIINNAYTFSSVWGNIGWWTSIFVVFITILTIIITSNEYTYRTNRQNVIDGLTRIQFYHSKYLMVLIFAIFTTIYSFIIGMVFGIANDDMSNFPGEIGKLFHIFILSLNYYSFGLLIAVLFKRSGISIGLFFLYTMIIESLLKSLLNWKLTYDIGNFLPLQASDELLPFPMIEIVKKMTQIEVSFSNQTYVIASIIWIVVYYLIGRFRLLKSDW